MLRWLFIRAFFLGCWVGYEESWRSMFRFGYSYLMRIIWFVVITWYCSFRGCCGWWLCLLFCLWLICGGLFWRLLFLLCFWLGLWFLWLWSLLFLFFLFRFCFILLLLCLFLSLDFLMFFLFVFLDHLPSTFEVPFQIFPSPVKMLPFVHDTQRIQNSTVS